MTEAFVLDLGSHDRAVRDRLDGDGRAIGLRRPALRDRLRARTGRLMACSREDAVRIAGDAVRDTVLVGTVYHHLTYGRVAGLDPEIGYVHIDNHRDDYLPPEEPAPDRLTNPRFTDRIRETGRPVAYVGEYTPAQPCLDARQLDAWEEAVWTGFCRELPDRLYVSVDMDVLQRSDFRATDSQGQLALRDLVELLDWLGEHRAVVGADVVGLDHGHPDGNYTAYGTVVDRLLDIVAP